MVVVSSHPLIETTGRSSSRKETIGSLVGFKFVLLQVLTTIMEVLPIMWTTYIVDGATIELTVFVSDVQTPGRFVATLRVDVVMSANTSTVPQTRTSSVTPLTVGALTFISSE